MPNVRRLAARGAQAAAWVARSPQGRRRSGPSRSEAVGSTSGTDLGASALMCDVRFQRYPGHECLGRRVLVEIMFTWRDTLTRSRQSSARLCVDAWVTANTSAKRHAPYITYMAVRPTGGSVGMGPAWAPFSVGGRG